MRHKKKLRHLPEFKDSDFKTLSQCDIRHTIYLMKLRVNKTTLMRKSMYCSVKLCDHKYTDTDTLLKRHIVDFQYI